MPHDSLSHRFNDLRPMIGNTPLLAIDLEYRGERRVIYAKAEHMNMTGSIKDRMAFRILARAWEDGTIRAGDTIVEATSGNTGISFAAIGRALGHRVVIFMPDWMSQERVALIRSLGAEIVPVSREEGGFTGSIRLTEEWNAREPSFLPCQFSNIANVEAHEESTGPEIAAQLASLGTVADAFIAGVGTGGTIMGAGRFLRRVNPSVRLHPLEPKQSPTLSTGHKVGHHRIQGVSDEFIPPILDLPSLDAIIAVDDGDAIVMAQRLAAELGLAVGISSGANFIGALKVQNRLHRDAAVATVFPDDNKKYLSTDLLRDEPLRDGFYSPEVRLLGYRAVGRVCGGCDPALPTR
jgi:cysteine synthase